MPNPMSSPTLAQSCLAIPQPLVISHGQLDDERHRPQHVVVAIGLEVQLIEAHAADWPHNDPTKPRSSVLTRRTAASRSSRSVIPKANRILTALGVQPQPRRRRLAPGARGCSRATSSHTAPASGVLLLRPKRRCNMACNTERYRARRLLQHCLTLHDPAGGQPRRQPCQHM